MRLTKGSLICLALVCFAGYGSGGWAQEFSVNTHRTDPYKQFKFRVKWDGRIIPGIFKISALKRNTEVIEHRQGGEPSLIRKLPGKTTYAAIVLVRGRTHDNAFEAWANKVWNFGAGLGSEASLKDFRKDIVIELLNEAGQLVMAFRVYRCWPSEYVAASNLDANGEATVATESLTLQHEGWERDPDVKEPVEPSFETPPRK